MPEIIYHVATSLDGFIADAEGRVDWLNDFNAFEDKEVMRDFQEFMNSFDAILLGGTTYDFALRHGQWMSPGTPTWVFTSRNLPLLDPGIQLTSETPQTACDELTARDLNRAWLMGGGKLATSFLDDGLVTQVDLAIIPILLGKGIPLISSIAKEPRLAMRNSKSYANGVVRVNYQVK